MSLKANKVFQPGMYPSHTYVERGDVALELELGNGLETPGQIISLSGPSKCGKTVLVERVVGRKKLVTVTGAGVTSPDEMWDRVLDRLSEPVETSRSIGGKLGSSVGGEAKGSVGIPLLAKSTVGAKGELSSEGSIERTTKRARRGLPDIVDRFGDGKRVILIDDFHYMKREIQAEVAEQLKEVARQGVKIVVVSVLHRSDDVVRANPDLRGRVLTIDVEYWSSHELRKIADKGFGLLNTRFQGDTIDRFVNEAAGSPQLMQAICLQTCFRLEVRRTRARRTSFNLPLSLERDILKDTARVTNCKAMIDVLDAGPRTRGTRRNSYRFVDGSAGDVYSCILKAIGRDPVRTSFTLEELTARTRAVCTQAAPTAASISSSCKSLHKIVSERFPEERAIEWDAATHVLTIVDPYPLFYLRWSKWKK